MSYKRYGPRTRRGRGWLLGILIAVLVLVLACGGLFLWARSQAAPDRVMPGVKAGSTVLDGMTREQVLSALRQAGYGGLEGQRLEIRVGEEEYGIPAEELGLTADLNAAADTVMAWGRSGSPALDAVNWLLSRVRSRELELEPPVLSLRQEAMEDFCQRAAEQLDREPTRSVVFPDEDSVDITLGVSGLRVDQAALLEAMKAALEDGSLRAEYDPEVLAPDTPDLKSIWEGIGENPENAKFDENYQVRPEQAGRTFDLEAAEALLASAGEGETLQIPLITLEPEVTAEELEALLFRDLLASIDTPLTNEAVRTENIRLAASRIDDTILLPGQEFSYNAALGERTEEKGYGAANAYLNGELVQEVGGGICQLSSALYCCALMADEEILERTNHAYYQTYVPLGFDATVSWGGPDFSFKLRDEYPIKMFARIEGDQLHVEFWGTKLEEGHIALEYEVNERIPHGTVYFEHKNVRSGSRVVTDYGRDGLVVTTYKAYYDGEGNLLERVELGTDRYSSRDQVIVVAKGERPR